MANTNKIDKGASLEYRILRLFFHMGYFSQIGIKLKTSEEDGANLITDLDVLGFDFSRNFSLKSIWADCKSGKADKLTRISWINGIKNYYYVDDILLVVANTRIEIKNFAKKSNIQIVDINIIEKLEQDFDVNKDDWSGSWDYTTQMNQMHMFRNISIPNNSMFKKIVDFIESDYWLYDDYAKLKKSITAIKQLSDYINVPMEEKNTEAIRWAINKLIVLFLLATMQISRELYYYNDEDKLTILRRKMMAGVLPERKWKEIFSAANHYALTIIKQHNPDFDSAVNIPAISAEPPEYFEAYFNLIMKLIRHPKQTFNALRYLDYVLMEYDLKAKDIDLQILNKLFLNCTDISVAAKSILHFICYISKLDKTFFSLLR